MNTNISNSHVHIDSQIMVYFYNKTEREAKRLRLLSTAKGLLFLRLTPSTSQPSSSFRTRFCFMLTSSLDLLLTIQSCVDLTASLTDPEPFINQNITANQKLNSQTSPARTQPVVAAPFRIIEQVLLISTKPDFIDPKNYQILLKFRPISLLVVITSATLLLIQTFCLLSGN